MPLKTDKIQLNSQEKKNPIRNSLSFFSSAVALPMQRRASFRRRNKCASIYDSILEESQTPHLLPAGFARARTPIEIESTNLLKIIERRFSLLIF